MEDLAYTKNNGFVDGVTNIIKKQLEDLKPTERPIHCSDAKRLKFYVKDNDKWEKDENNEKLDNTIRDVKLKQTKTMTEWEKQNPTYKQDSKLMDEWMDILDNVSEGPDNPKKAKTALKKKIASCTEIKDAMDKSIIIFIKKSNSDVFIFEIAKIPIIRLLISGKILTTILCPSVIYSLNFL